MWCTPTEPCLILILYTINGNPFLKFLAMPLHIVILARYRLQWTTVSVWFHCLYFTFPRASLLFVCARNHLRFYLMINLFIRDSRELFITTHRTGSAGQVRQWGFLYLVNTGLQNTWPQHMLRWGSLLGHWQILQIIWSGNVLEKSYS